MSEPTPAEIEKALYRTRRSSHPQKAPPEKRTCDGYVFDSITEMERYRDVLKNRQLVGEIIKLQIHTKFKFELNGVHLGYYTADFTYIETATNSVVVEDAKGFKVSKKTGKLLPRVDREFGIKCKLMLALFGLEVKVV